MSHIDIGGIVDMKKTMSIDAKLLKDVKAACGAATEKDTVRLGLVSPTDALAPDGIIWKGSFEGV